MNSKLTAEGIMGAAMRMSAKLSGGEFPISVDFLQVFVPRVLIFKKLHLLLHPKMEVQGEKCVENH